MHRCSKDGVKTILVVDDKGINRLLPGLILRPFGWTVHEVASGLDVLTQLKTLEAACVLLDLSMPDISGLDVLKQIRACSFYGGIKIIAYTAYATHDDKDHLMEMGFDAVLIKPITSSQLLEIL
jgi:two-component system cell cycle response regulator DivK